MLIIDQWKQLIEPLASCLLVIWSPALQVLHLTGWVRRCSRDWLIYESPCIINNYSKWFVDQSQFSHDASRCWCSWPLSSRRLIHQWKKLIKTSSTNVRSPLTYQEVVSWSSDPQTFKSFTLIQQHGGSSTNVKRQLSHQEVVSFYWSSDLIALGHSLCLYPESDCTSSHCRRPVVKLNVIDRCLPAVCTS